MPHTFIGQITYAIFDILCLIALWRGDFLQKLSGLVLLAANTATPLIQDRVHWMDPGARFMIEDCLLLLFFLALALHYGRAWMIVVAACQLLSTLSHPAAHFSRQISPAAYIIIFQLFSYSVYLSLGIASVMPKTGDNVRVRGRL